MPDFPNDKAELWNHQLEGHLKARDQEEFGWLFDVGTGKTLTCITTLRYKYAQAKRLMPTLILSPIITLENWKNEFGLFSNTPSERILILVGPVKRRIKQLLEAYEKYRGQIVVITNYEAIGASKEFAEVLERIGFEILVLDESHRCKTHNSNRTKRINKLADISRFRFILTGTFITNSPFDAFAQFRILDKGKSFGRNFSRFRNKYFYDANAGMPKDKYFPDWKIRSGALEEMNAIIKQKTMRAIKEDCIDLPEKVENTISVEMTPKQKKAYLEMEKNLITYINDEAVTAEMALTKMLRLCQIASGFVKTEEGQIIRFENNEKEKALKELLFDICKEGNGKVIVWAVFKENYKQIREVCEKLDLDYVEGHGEISSKQKFANVERFNTDDSCSVFIGHPKSVGIGINLKQAGYSIYFSRDFSLEARLQSEARNYRGGSIDLHDKITQTDLSCRGTIDEKIDQALADKLATAEEILKLVKTSF